MIQDAAQHMNYINAFYPKCTLQSIENDLLLVQFETVYSKVFDFYIECHSLMK
jgi:hypothetical protein